MCGIFGYVGKKEASKILLRGLKAVEYRGYDSAGLFSPETGIIKSAGEVKNLVQKTKGVKIGNDNTWGIAHTRWATHGNPNETNAHPHSDCLKSIFVVHNGIIENYQEIKDRLILKGHHFKSETDSEVIGHLLEDKFKKEKDTLKSITATLKELRGTYGLAIVNKKEPERIFFARMGSPLVIGLGKGENLIASDPASIITSTKKVIFLNDGDVGFIEKKKYKILNSKQTSVRRPTVKLDWEEEKLQKAGYKYFMMKEIMEAPEVVRASLRGRLITNKGDVKLGGLEDVRNKLKGIDRIIIVGCGTAYYAGLVGKYMLEEYAGIPVEVELGSEFRYRKPIINKKTVVIAISQSGETADTLEAIREAKKKGALTLGIVNATGSSIARETDAGVYNHAGPEIGVASTKAFVSQLTVLALLTIFLGRQRRMSKKEGMVIAEELEKIPQKIGEILKKNQEIRSLAKKYLKNRDFLFIGRKYNYPVANEGALKLKELSYIHSEGCSAGEMKHGFLAMIDKNFPTFAIATEGSTYEKTLSNIEEIKAREGRVIALANEGNGEIKRLANDVIYVPKTIELLSPILNVIPLQLFAYHFADLKKLNVDKPRNLAKSVTVE